MTDTELSDLVKTAARTTAGDVRPDAGALILRARRSRRRHRIVGLCGVVVLALLGATAVPALLDRGDGGVEVAAGDATDGFQPGWTRLPDPPLSPRSRATSVWTGKEIVVVGGSNVDCPPSTGCLASPEPVLADGAAFDVEAQTWRTIKRSPIAFERQRAAVLDGEVYVLAPCRLTGVDRESWQPRCEVPLLRYRPSGDTWDVLPPLPGPEAGHEMVAVAGSLYALGTDDGGQERLWRFDPAPSTWSVVRGYPSDLVARTQLLADGDDLLVFGEDVKLRGAPTEKPVVAGARLATKSGTWSALPNPQGHGVLPQVVDGVVVLHPSSARATVGGGTLDLASGSWRPFPKDQAGQIPVHGRLGVAKLAGAVGPRSASFAGTSGYVFDTATQVWLKLDPVDPRTNESIVSFGRRLFSFGGNRSPGFERLSDAWMWTPPAAEVTAPPTTLAQDPGPATVPPADPVGPTPTSPQAAPPAPPLTPGAPVFLSATGDAAAGRVTLRFDRPVTGDPVDKSPGSKTFSPDKTHPMNMIVFGPDKACTSPQGNGQDYVSGLGTDTVTFAATSLAPGTTYVGIGRGVVKSVADATFNDPVVLKDLPSAGMFAGMSCIPITTSGTVPTTVPYTDPVGGPELLSATATSGAGGPPPAPGTGAGRITLKFDKPVVPGDGPNFDGTSPNLQPPEGDNYMRAMQLVVHTTDSSCSSPNGNAHAYLAGVGTDTLTVDATSLVVGTTYISIAPGFAKAKADGKAMRWVRCFALTVTA